MPKKLLILIAIFLVVGTVGHDAWWKLGETYSFGIIQHFLVNHSWLVPTNADIPFMEKPPLYYWTAVIFCKIFGWVLSLPDAARLASIFYMGITIIFLWKTAKLLFEKSEMANACVLLLLSTYGLLRFEHSLLTDIALLAGTTIAIYGLALLLKGKKYAGIYIALGVGISFMTKGIIIPAMLAISGLSLLALLPNLRTKATLKTVLIAFVCAAPFLFIWSGLLYLESPQLFMDFFWKNNIGRFLGFAVDELGAKNRPFYFLYMSPIFCFPIFPLAVANLIKNRTNWRTHEYILPCVISCVAMAILLSSASGRNVYLIPLMPAFSLLATQVLFQIQPKFLLIWNKLTIISFYLATLVVWILFADLLSHKFGITHFFKDSLPINFMPTTNYIIAIVTAFIVLLFWIFAIRKKDSPEATARIWFASVALIWCSIYSLLMPWIEESKSFAPVFSELNQFIKTSQYKEACIGSDIREENVLPMLYYYSKSKIVRQNANAKNCPIFLEFSGKDAPHLTLKLLWKSLPFLETGDGQLRLYETK